MKPETNKSPHSYSKPVQIWPEPKRIHNFPFVHKAYLASKKKAKLRLRKKSAKHKTNILTARNRLQKFYKFIVISAIVTAIFSNGYFIFTKLAPQGSNSKNVPAPVAQFNIFQEIINSNISNDLPIRLRIPSINVDAAIQQLGLTPEGALDVPDNLAIVGWYKFGPRPGQKGSAVIDGHVDGPDGLPAVFNRLHDLREGDEIVIINDKNKTVLFTVKKIKIYSADDYVSDVFNKNDGFHLNLITCNGIWDINRKTYTERIVVFADARF